MTNFLPVAKDPHMRVHSPAWWVSGAGGINQHANSSLPTLDDYRDHRHGAQLRMKTAVIGGSISGTLVGAWLGYEACNPVAGEGPPPGAGRSVLKWAILGAATLTALTMGFAKLSHLDDESRSREQFQRDFPASDFYYEVVQPKTDPPSLQPSVAPGNMG